MLASRHVFLFRPHYAVCLYNTPSISLPVQIQFQIGREREEEIRPGYSGPLNKSVQGRNAQLRLGAQIQKTRDEHQQSSTTLGALG